jgi:hypothetical protein
MPDRTSRGGNPRGMAELDPVPLVIVDGQCQQIIARRPRHRRDRRRIKPARKQDHCCPPLFHAARDTRPAAARQAPDRTGGLPIWNLTGKVR